MSLPLNQTNEIMWLAVVLDWMASCALLQVVVAGCCCAFSLPFLWCRACFLLCFQFFFLMHFFFSYYRFPFFVPPLPPPPAFLLQIVWCAGLYRFLSACSLRFFIDRMLHGEQIANKLPCLVYLQCASPLSRNL